MKKSGDDDLIWQIPIRESCLKSSRTHFDAFNFARTCSYNCGSMIPVVANFYCNFSEGEDSGGVNELSHCGIEWCIKVLLIYVTFEPPRRPPRVFFSALCRKAKFKFIKGRELSWYYYDCSDSTTRKKPLAFSKANEQQTHSPENKSSLMLRERLLRRESVCVCVK